MWSIKQMLTAERGIYAVDEYEPKMSRLVLMWVLAQHTDGRQQIFGLTGVDLDEDLTEVLKVLAVRPPLYKTTQELRQLQARVG